jgi:chromosome segregation ATPase
MRNVESGSFELNRPIEAQTPPPLEETEKTLQIDLSELETRMNAIKGSATESETQGLKEAFSQLETLLSDKEKMEQAIELYNDIETLVQIFENFQAKKISLLKKIESLYPFLTEEEKAGMTLDDAISQVEVIQQKHTQKMNAFASKVEAKNKEIKQEQEYQKKLSEIKRKLDLLADDEKKLYSHFLDVLNNLHNKNILDGIDYAEDLLKILNRDLPDIDFSTLPEDFANENNPLQPTKPEDDDFEQIEFSREQN